MSHVDYELHESSPILPALSVVAEVKWVEEGVEAKFLIVCLLVIKDVTLYGCSASIFAILKLLILGELLVQS